MYARLATLRIPRCLGILPKCNMFLCYSNSKLMFLRQSLLVRGNKSLTESAENFKQSAAQINVKKASGYERNYRPVNTSRPRISAASVINEVFEKKVTSDALPSNLPGRDGSKSYTRTLQEVAGRRAFLYDSLEYRLTSLEIFRELQPKYSKDDDEKVGQLFQDAVLKKLGFLSLPEVTAALCILSRTPKSKMSLVDNQSLEDIVEVACQHLGAFSNQEFCSVLLALFKMPVSPSSEQFKVLEAECEKRLTSFDVKSLLLVADWWIQIQHRPVFVQSVLRTLSIRWKELTIPNIVQIFYIIGECQYVGSEDFLQQLTDSVHLHLDSLSWNEVGAVCNSFIKTRVRVLSRPLHHAISARICQDINTERLTNYNLVTAMRFISRGYFHNWRLFEEMATSLTPHIPTLPFLVPPHIATAFAKVRHFNRPLMDAIARRVVKNDANVRLKDIWMLIWAYCRLNYDPPVTTDFFERLIQQLRIQLKKFDQPYQFLKSLVSLTFIGQYPKDLINQAFSAENLKEYEEKCPSDVYKHLFALDCSLSIENPDYRGNRLPQEFIDKFWQRPHASQKNSKEKIPCLHDALEALQSMLGGPEYVLAHPILPHIRTPFDIEVHLDSSNKPLALNTDQSSALEQVGIPSMESAPSDVQRLAVLASPSAHYRLYTKDLLGAHVMKRRQLWKVGYKIVEIPYYEWQPLASERLRQDYLKAKLFQ